MAITAEPLIRVLPLWLRSEIREEDLKEILEIRLRSGRAVEIVTIYGSRWLKRRVVEDDLRFCVNMSSKYSPWTVSSIYDGYITIEGGHRIGVAGSWVIDDSGRRSIQQLISLCIRVSKDFQNISGDLHLFDGSLLIVGQPGSGKTTLLRDLVRRISDYHSGGICVVDERKELFPMNASKMCYPVGNRTDVLSGYPKAKGIQMAIRCMGARMIAIDEITASEDCAALMEAGWCGVDVLATAHASSKEDLYKRPVYKPLVESKLFQGVVVMNKDKSWYLERM